MHELWAALVFYTCLPLGKRPLPFERIARWLPLVGLVVGIFLCLLHGLARNWFSPAMAALVTVLGWSVLTGGLHLDGLMDTADGWACGKSLERRLKVMAESTVGAYAVLAALGVLAAKTIALTDLAGQAVLPLLVASVLSRWGQVVAIGAYPYLRAAGKGRFHKDYMDWPRDGLTSTVWVVAVAVVLGFEFPVRLVVLTVLVGFLVAWLCGWWIAREFGGHTGDTYGAVVEVSEAVTLVLCTLLVG